MKTKIIINEGKLRFLLLEIKTCVIRPWATLMCTVTRIHTFIISKVKIGLDLLNGGVVMRSKKLQFKHDASNRLYRV